MALRDDTEGKGGGGEGARQSLGGSLIELQTLSVLKRRYYVRLPLTEWYFCMLNDLKTCPYDPVTGAK